MQPHYANLFGTFDSLHISPTTVPLSTNDMDDVHEEWEDNDIHILIHHT